ncbi:MAG: hypothetical protein V4772_08615 [Pseudomonadota bacterium]
MIDNIDIDVPGNPITSHEKQSTLAFKMRTYLDERAYTLRVKNESDLDPVATAKLRGELKAIRGLKNLLALVNPAPAMVADDEQV